MKLFYKTLIWVVVFIYIGFIFFNSLMSGEVSGSLSMKLAKEFVDFINQYKISMSITLFHMLLRKFAHFIEFFGLGILVSIAITTCPFLKSKITNFILFLVIIPVSDELIQYFIPDRVLTFKDMLIDSFGMICGGFLVYICILIIKDLFKITK